MLIQNASNESQSPKLIEELAFRVYYRLPEPSPLLAFTNERASIEPPQLQTTSQTVLLESFESQPFSGNTANYLLVSCTGSNLIYLRKFRNDGKNTD